MPAVRMLGFSAGLLSRTIVLRRLLEDRKVAWVFLLITGLSQQQVILASLTPPVQTVPGALLGVPSVVMLVTRGLMLGCLGAGTVMTLATVIVSRETVFIYTSATNTLY